MADELLERRSFDAITDLAEAFPLSVFPDAMGLPHEKREHLLPFAGLVFNAFGPHNAFRRKALAEAAPHVAWVFEQCRRENLAPDGLRRRHPRRRRHRRDHAGGDAAAGPLAADRRASTRR